MGSITYSKLRQNLASVLDKVHEDRISMVIERRNGKPVMLVPVDEYESLQETRYLTRSPANAKRLRQSIAEAAAGKLKAHGLTSPHGNGGRRKRA